jgi:citrate lyase subunit beta/citryl-CoA lyase
MMEDLVRRSLLRVPVHDRDAVADSWRHGADAVVLDLGDGAGSPAREAVRALLRDAIAAAGRGGAEVFVQIDKSVVDADLAAAVWPGLTGIVLPCVESPAEVQDAAATLETLERSHGLAPRSAQLIILLGSAAGVWGIRELLGADARVSSAGLDATALCRSLGIIPREDFDPLQYAAGRLVVECTAARVQPIGISHPLDVLPRLLDPDKIERLAQRGRNTGFKGAICPDPSWVEPCNRAFTPTPEQIEYYREVRRVFAEGIAQDRAAVPLGEQMLDVPVDERAKKQIALWERCQQRDLEKTVAVAANARAG